MNSAIELFNLRVKRRSVEAGFTIEQIQDIHVEGVLATYDVPLKTRHLFEIFTPEPPTEVSSYPRRASVGTGSSPATVFLKNMEYLMEKEGVGLHWTNFSTRLVGQLLTILLRRVEHVDPYSSGISLYRLDGSGVSDFPPKELWKNPSEKYRLTTLLRTIINELPKDRLAHLFREYEFDKVFRELVTSPRLNQLVGNAAQRPPRTGKRSKNSTKG